MYNNNDNLKKKNRIMKIYFIIINVYNKNIYFIFYNYIL